MSKGYATVIRYRQDDDQRASCYDDLLSAEAKASKSSKGLHNKKETPIHRVADLSSVSGSKLLHITAWCVTRLSLTCSIPHITDL